MRGAVRLHSDAIELEVLPACGGRIVSLRDRRSGREALWSSATRPHRPHPPGTGFDDVFAGGWDELVPNDAPTERDGRRLPDHGDLWTAALDVVALDARSVRLAGTLPLSGLAVDKRIAVAGDEVVVELGISNPAAAALGLELKVHPALRIAAGARVLAAPGPAHVPDPALSRAAADFEWPAGTGHDGLPVRLDVVPPGGAATEWVVLPEALRRGGGRCGLVHDREDWAVTMTVDPEALPALWLFADYGGWQDSRFLLLEPAAEAAPLAPGQAIETAVRCRVGSAELAGAVGGAP